MPLAHPTPARLRRGSWRVMALLLAISPGFGVSPLAYSADTAVASPGAVDPLAAARSQVTAHRWPEALAELKRVNDTGSADWNNLMGYCLRMGTPPDLAGADRHYREALRIDPVHRGALEYSGELALMQGDLALAEQRLAVLDKACRFGCEEYTDLKQAVQRYKAAGNRYQPQP